MTTSPRTSVRSIHSCSGLHCACIVPARCLHCVCICHCATFTCPAVRRQSTLTRNLFKMHFFIYLYLIKYFYPASKKFGGKIVAKSVIAINLCTPLMYDIAFLDNFRNESEGVLAAHIVVVRCIPFLVFLFKRQ